MCFSPEADFAAAAAVGAVGVATLRLVRTPRELIIGLLPLLFAVHQLVEAFVWLGLRGQIGTGLGNAARDAYVVFAFPILPIIVPIGFLLIEPSPRHRRRLIPFVALGVGVGLFLFWQIIRHPVGATVHDDGISYDVHGTGMLLGAAYVVATCVPAMLSSRRYLQWFGLVNLVAVGVAATVHRVEFASIWCLYAALASLLILEHFRRERAAEEARGSAPPTAQAVAEGGR